MDHESLSQRLSHISTMWSLVHQAHGDKRQAATLAQDRLMARYTGAIHRYLLGALRDVDAADELFQEFAVRFLRGDFRNAEQGKGRFRSFLKTSLYHLIVDYQKRQKKQPQGLVDLEHAPVSHTSQPDSDREFMDSCRQELMERAWLALANLEQQTGQPSFTVLRFRTEHPLLASAELAEQLGSRLGKTLTVDGVRKALQRARENFVNLLLEEVIQTLDRSSRDELEEELVALGLLSYCKSALQRWRPR
jgi:RNA polymerase sigma factor (sigma-70 family)